MNENNKLKELKEFFIRNRQIITAYVLSSFIIFAVIFLFSQIQKSNNRNIASHGEISSEDNLKNTEDIYGESLEDSSMNTSDDNSDSKDSTLSDIDFTLPEDVTDEPETTLANSSYQYMIKVNRLLNCVTVYTKDSNGEFTVPYKAMACSTGKNIKNTPIGTFKTSNKYPWRLMVDGTHSQYATRVYGGILFHSVPCYSPKKDQLEYEEFNKLGEPASLGCIRLTVQDSKWIYDNCPSGTTVTIYDDASSPGPLGKPQVIKIPLDSPYRNWDPTDPDSANPWNNCAPSITASDITVKAGTSFNILSTFKAADTCGNDISSSISVTGNYNKDVAGVYTLNLSVTDLLGRSAATIVKVTVEKNSTQGTSNRPTASPGQIKR